MHKIHHSPALPHSTRDAVIAHGEPKGERSHRDLPNVYFLLSFELVHNINTMEVASYQCTIALWTVSYSLAAKKLFAFLCHTYTNVKNMTSILIGHIVE